MSALLPIPTLHLFPTLDNKLIDLLSSLTPAEWQLRTIVPNWGVIDIAAHLLDGNIRSLSMLRDDYHGETSGEINDYKDLVSYLNRLNADWVQAMKRVSPTMLIELLKLTGKPYIDFLGSLDPWVISKFSVAWAGEQESYNWFHIAREYTEKWHHQQQIRLAIGQEQELYSNELYHPYLETSMRALPHHYRDVKGVEGEMIRFTITGGGGDWYLYHNDEKWIQVIDYELEAVCKVEIPGNLAWRLFTNTTINNEIINQVSITGRQELGQNIFGMKAVMI